MDQKSVDLVGLGVTLGFEIVKMVRAEQSVKRAADAAGLSPEALEAAVERGRGELKILDPNLLKEV